MTMFKNLIIYRIGTLAATLDQAEAALQKAPFAECGATQEKSSGWVPPRGEAHGALAESVGGQWVLRFMTESKVIPGTVLARKVKEKAAQIEQQTGRIPGKKETKELKDEAKHMCQLLGKHWLVNIIHSDNGKEGAERRVYANVRNDDGYTFRPPVRIVGDELAGDAKEIPIPAPEVLSELRLFLWDFPTKPMWDSLYIPGEYEERKDEKTGKVIAPAKSKNVIQEKIKSALNWVGSPMHELLQEGDGLELGELGETEVDTGTAPETGAAAGDDPLAGI